MTTALITGANRGIGLELAKQLTGRGTTVIAAVRKASSELEATGAEIVAGIDVTHPEDVAKLAKTLSGRSIDLLINNAGILRDTPLDRLNYDLVEEQLRVNAVAPLRVTQALLPNLGKGAKVALITSRMGSMADNTSGGGYGYRMSKAALNAAGKSLAVDLGARGIAVGMLHPGWVKTDMTSHSGLTTPQESAHDLLARIDELTLDNSGTFFHANGEILPF